jgi:hypothetical protein
MKRHFRYANVTATLALLLAMSGGAMAAGHYLINSTRQINPKVLRKLRGNVGPRGAQGAPGPPATALASGQTITGSFAATAPRGSEGKMIASISYPVTLAVNPTPEVSLSGESIPGCPGSASAPAADAGFLCIYMGRANAVQVNAEVQGTSSGGGDFRNGAAVVRMLPNHCSECQPEMLGTWAYKAP